MEFGQLVLVIHDNVLVEVVIEIFFEMNFSFNPQITKIYSNDYNYRIIPWFFCDKSVFSSAVTSAALPATTAKHMFFLNILSTKISLILIYNRLPHPNILYIHTTTDLILACKPKETKLRLGKLSLHIHLSNAKIRCNI